MLRSIASNPALRGNMLNRAKSNPALRAATSFVPPVPSRSLVSTVLLTKDTYEAKKVVELKSELKNRGLSTSGKRSDLIKRLVNNDSKRSMVLPTGDVPKKAHVRSRSVTSSTTPPEPSEGAVGTDSKGATIPHPPNMEPGQVSALPGVGEALEALSTAPGVPPANMPKAPITFEVIIPYAPAPVEAGPEIPLMTSYFHPENRYFDGQRSPDDGPIAHLPKVLTVSGEETYLGGGVSHHQPTFDDVPSESGSSQPSPKIEEYTFTSAVSSLWSSFQNDMGVQRVPVPKVGKQVKDLQESAAGTTRTFLKETFSSAIRGNGKASYSTASYSGGNTRPLNDAERSGLYVLGGIVVGGFVLGGLGGQSKRKSEKVKSKIEESVKEIRNHSKTLNDDELHKLVQRAEQVLKA